jgi:hypothetical protein
MVGSEKSGEPRKISFLWPRGKIAIWGMRADQIISLFMLAIVRRQFPAQFLLRTFEEIQVAARANEPGARKVLKLLLSRRFDK